MGTDQSTITPGFSITHTHLINLDTTEIVFSIGTNTGGANTDITLPAEGNISLSHQEASYIAYKSGIAGGNFMCILQGIGST